MTEPAAAEGVPARPARTLREGAWRFAALVSFLLLSLFMLSDATRNPTRFGEFYTPLIGLTVAGLAVLSTLLVRDFGQLAREVRTGRPGARLTVRMVAIFSLLAVTPVVVIYFFSVQLLHRNVDNWLDVRIEQALEGALELSRVSLNRNMRERLKQVELLAVRISDLLSAPPEPDRPRPDPADLLHDAFDLLGASEIVLMSSNGRVIAASTHTTALVPSPPDEAVLLQVRQSGTYVGLDPIDESGLLLRVVVNIASPVPGQEARFVQALFPVAKRVNELESGVRSAFERYRELIYLRVPLKTSFMLTLSLVLLVSLLSAVWAAVFAARRLTAPLRGMAELTRSVAAGDYGTRLSAEGADEIGFLVDSFNDMTYKLAVARDEARDSHRQLEEQRTYLEAVLSRQSSGVLTTGHDGRLVTFNRMAEGILGLPLDRQTGAPLGLLGRRDPRLAPFAGVLEARVLAARSDWREEVELAGRHGRQILTCRGTVLPGLQQVGPGPGHVIVFDDVTALIEAQRSQAWEEVARRLAHEIKNPLTPIRLSAERLRDKYLGRMEGADAESLDRLTRTIVHQVESLKEMVDAFSKYARTPERRTRVADVNELVSDVAELYRDENGRGAFALDLGHPLPPVEVDPGQLRQVIHNLVRNAGEAVANRQDADASAGRPDAVLAPKPAPGAESEPSITVGTRQVVGGGREYVEIRVSDRGAGISGAVMDRLFEPYVSTKPKGTGIGLAIVRKIVEEHEGTVTAENRPEGGASFVVRLPATAAGVASAPPAVEASPEAVVRGETPHGFPPATVATAAAAADAGRG